MGTFSRPKGDDSSFLYLIAELWAGRSLSSKGSYYYSESVKVSSIQYMFSSKKLSPVLAQGKAAQVRTRF